MVSIVRTSKKDKLSIESRALTISKMLDRSDRWEECVLEAVDLEREGNSRDAVSLLRAAERKFPNDIHYLHKNLFEMMRRQKGMS